MAHDFAKQRNNSEGGARRKRAVSKTPVPGNANWSWFFSGLMTGVIVSIATYLGVVKLEEGVVEDAQAVQAAAAAENQPTFSFYEVLSNAEVAVNVPNAAAPGAEAGATAQTPAEGTALTGAVAASAVPAEASSEKPALYLLQAGSFQNKEGAESRRARIILLNMNANVVEGIVGGRTHYSVQVGPFTGRQSAEDARAILATSDIESIPLLVPPP